MPVAVTLLLAGAAVATALAFHPPASNLTCQNITRYYSLNTTIGNKLIINDNYRTVLIPTMRTGLESDAGYVDGAMHFALFYYDSGHAFSLLHWKDTYGTFEAISTEHNGAMAGEVKARVNKKKYVITSSQGTYAGLSKYKVEIFNDYTQVGHNVRKVQLIC